MICWETGEQCRLPPDLQIPGLTNICLVCQTAQQKDVLKKILTYDIISKSTVKDLLDEVGRKLQDFVKFPKDSDARQRLIGMQYCYMHLLNPAVVMVDISEYKWRSSL